MKTEKSMNVVEDIELVETIKTNIEVDGEKRVADKAFEILFNKYKNHLSFMVRSQVSSSDEVDDLTMLAFEKAYTKIRTYNEQCGAFSTWLYTIFNNVFIDYIRKKKQNVISLSEMVHTNEEGQDIPYVPSTGEKTIEEIMADKEVRKAVRKCIGEMKNEFYKQLIDLKFYKDMCYEAMAEELEKPIGTIKTSLMRAKEELKVILMRNPMFS